MNSAFLKVKATIYQNVSENFMISSAEGVYGDADFIFQQDQVPAQTARSTNIWFDGHSTSQLTGPQPSLESTGYCQDEHEGEPDPIIKKKT